ncbi:MAG: ABC transporter ATP-binding protein [Nitrospirae bacterium]|nr:MAG: ABC transporter ATP-binding protein [Nitrospirota bacterium]
MNRESTECDSVVRLEKVSKVYQRGAASIWALRGVSLEVPHGQFLALMGPSGSGKSTLLNMISGLDRPTEGDVVIEGRSTRGLSESDWTLLRRERIGLVFQFFNLLPGLTAQENVELPLLLRGDPQPQERARNSLRAVGLDHRAGHRPGELSGGEQQRVALARALVHRPTLLLADEPTGNLDSCIGREIVQLMKGLAQESGQTVILATHSREAASAADRVLVLHDGTLEAEMEV